MPDRCRVFGDQPIRGPLELSVVFDADPQVDTVELAAEDISIPFALADADAARDGRTLRATL